MSARRQARPLTQGMGGAVIQISYQDPRPIYEQVRDAYRQQILAGVLVPGEQLPSVRELSSRLAVNPNTIQRAYRELSVRHSDPRLGLRSHLPLRL